MTGASLLTLQAFPRCSSRAIDVSAQNDLVRSRRESITYRGGHV